MSLKRTFSLGTVAGGNHLTADCDEPEPLPVEQREVQHTDDWHRRNDARAAALDLQHLDVMRRIGAL